MRTNRRRLEMVIAAVLVLNANGCAASTAMVGIPGRKSLPIPLDTVIYGPRHWMLWSKLTTIWLTIHVDSGQIVRVDLVGAPLDAGFSVSAPWYYLGGSRYVGGETVASDYDGTESGRPLGGDFLATETGRYDVSVARIHVGKPVRLTIRPVTVRTGRPPGSAPREMVLARKQDVVTGQRPAEATTCSPTDVIVAYVRGQAGVFPLIHVIDSATGARVKLVKPRIKTAIAYVELGQLGPGTYRVDYTSQARPDIAFYSKRITVRE